MIPKIIHYCWFGKNEKSKIINECIESWRKYLPDWELIEWNEDNYDVNVNMYVKGAYALKKWAYVSDYVRLDVLYKYGGIYLDVDVEFIKELPNDLLYQKCFCGFEYTSMIAPGLIWGTEKENEFIKNILDSYENEEFVFNEKGRNKTINVRITNALEKEGLIKNNQYQKIGDIAVYPSEYFCGYNTDIGEPEITEKTICWHHYIGSWSSPTFKSRIQNLLKKILGVNNYKKLFYFIRKVRN